jgi:hypothetical protein
MAVPSGYTKLGVIGYAFKGTYNETTTYNKYHTVYYDGSTFVCLQDNVINQTPENDGVYWHMLAKGFDETFVDDLKEMIIANRFYAAISADDTDSYELADDDETLILADWRFKEA